MLELAEHILQSRATDFDRSQFVDHYEEAVVEILNKTQAGIVVSRERAAPRPRNVVNLMDALRRSIAQEKAASALPKRPRKPILGQGEMLLPISGRKGNEAAEKPVGRPNTRQKKSGPWSGLAPGSTSTASPKSRKSWGGHRTGLP
jgi:DNA end-binding protein Ku